jgi:hypothetical protein
MLNFDYPYLSCIPFRIPLNVYHARIIKKINEHHVVLLNFISFSSQFPRTSPREVGVYQSTSYHTDHG